MFKVDKPLAGKFLIVGNYFLRPTMGLKIIFNLLVEPEADGSDVEGD